MLSIRRITLAVIMAILILNGSFLQAATYYISPSGLDSNDGSAGSPFLTITAGINAAANTSDTLILKDGTYSGTGNAGAYIGERAIHITSENGPEAAVIDGGGTQIGLAISTGLATRVDVNGIGFANCFASDTTAFGPTGGGIVVLDSGAVIQNCRFTNCIAQGATTATNTVSYEGGAIAIYGPGPGTQLITGCTFINNQTFGQTVDAFNSGGAGLGGAIYIEKSSTIIENCIFSGNKAWGGDSLNIDFPPHGYAGGGGGGAIAVSAPDESVIIRGCSFNGNQANSGLEGNAGSRNWAGFGGAVYVAGAAGADIERCSFNGNLAGNISSNGAGGSIYVDVNSGLRISESALKSGFAQSGSFGGSAIYFADSSTSTVGACEISQHTSANNGAVLKLFDKATATFTNTSIVGNDVADGILRASVSAPSVALTLTMTNCTVASNSSALPAVSIAGVPLANVQIKNNIFAGNTPANLDGFPTSLGGNISSDASAPLSGTGDLISTDPMLAASLADNGGPTRTLALLAGSPAIDRGIAAGSPSTDQRGFPRPVDGNGAGGAQPDSGAYEYGSSLYDGRLVGDFDNSHCTDINDFLFLLDNWLLISPIGGAEIGINDFLALLDNWNLGTGC